MCPRVLVTRNSRFLCTRKVVITNDFATDIFQYNVTRVIRYFWNSCKRFQNVLKA